MVKFMTNEFQKFMKILLYFYVVYLAQEMLIFLFGEFDFNRMQIFLK